MIFEYFYYVCNQFPIRIILGVKIAEYPERNISNLSRNSDSNF